MTHAACVSAVPLAAYRRRVSSRKRRHARPSPRPRSSGPALAEAIAFSEHALARFAQRATDTRQHEETALRSLIARQGMVLAKPPAWFHGDPPPGGFLVGIAGRYVLPVARAPRRGGFAPARAWLATTFISRDLSADLATLSGEDIAALTFLPQKVISNWAAHSPGETPATHTALRAALARIPAGAPALSSRPAAAAGRDELHVTLPAGTLVVIRAERHERHGDRLRATAWLPTSADPAAAVSHELLGRMRRMLGSTGAGTPQLTEVEAAAQCALTAAGARRWLDLPNRDLGGQTPADAIAAGRGAEALAAAFRLIFPDGS